MKKSIATTVLAGALWASTATAGNQEFHYDEKSVEPATYYAAITNLANAIMFSDLGEKLIVSPYERDDLLRRAGYVTRPPMPDMGIVGPVYASSEAAFVKTPDFSKPETLRWKKETFDRTLDPGAQAWTLLKITSPQFHLQFHDLPENKIAALMMLPQARVQARVLDDRLRNGDGLFAPRSPEGKFLAPSSCDQVAVLWAASSLILAATSPRDDYWHRAYGDLTKADDYRPLADYAFKALANLPPQAPAEKAIAIAALGRYALAVKEETRRRRALDLARLHADSLRIEPGETLEGIALAVYGLTEAGRLFGDKGYAEAATNRFRSALMPLWDATIGVFRTGSRDKNIAYSPVTVGAVIAALNAMRWYGPADLAAKARQLYPLFFENAVVRSGLLRASPLLLVSGKYLDAEPASNFAHPALPAPKDAGVAPVFASQVAFEGGEWKVTDPVFRTSNAMFLVNMLAMRTQGRADPFLPEDRLDKIR